MYEGDQGPVGAAEPSFEPPTLPAEQQWRGDLRSVPRNYLHRACGATTQMPEGVIRTYLVDPFFYAYKSYCAGCHRHIPMEQLTWVSTRQNLLDYTRDLQAANPNSPQLRRKIVVGFFVAAAVLSGLAGVVFAAIAYALVSLIGALVAFVLTLVLGTLGTFALFVAMRRGI